MGTWEPNSQSLDLGRSILGWVGMSGRDDGATGQGLLEESPDQDEVAGRGGGQGH